MNNLIEEHFQIETANRIFQAKYVAPKWSKGFDCSSSVCGLCCISEIPTGVPTKIFEPLDCKICKNYNIGKKVCEDYSKRQWGCKTYPFIFGIEKDKIIISPALECASTNKQAINLDPFKNMFKDFEVNLTLKYMEDSLNNVKFSPFWKSPYDYWSLLEEQLNKYFSAHYSFPILDEVSKIIHASMEYHFNVKAQAHRYPPIYQLIENITNGKIFISTSFKASEVYFVRIKKFKVLISIWNPSTNKIKNIKSVLPMKPLEFEITKDAMELLVDYFALLFKRPFLSLSALQAFETKKMIPALLSSNLAANLVHLETAANFFNFKFPNGEINREVMREIISFADGSLLSLFRNPVQTGNQTSKFH